ncbi:MAG: LysR family transcriptional regulator [Halioglobus sp.]|nr:LysR family transcriptional regulator [Halioglobus sp.]
MNLTQLRLFRDIAREKSFARAARLNHITQPAVSVHIKKLEHELAMVLFRRSPGSVELTPDGLAILQDVKEILRLSEGLKNRASLDRGELVGSIRLATIHSIGMYELGDFLAAFMKSHPNVALHMEFQRYDDIYDLLLRDKIDIGLVAYPERRTNIESIPYGSDELELIAAPGHRLGQRTSVTLEQLDGEAFIAFEEGMPTRIATDAMLGAAGVAVDIRMTNDNIYTMKKAVQGGVGVAIIPGGTLEEEVALGMLARVRIRGADTRRPLALLKRRGARFNAAIQAFVEELYRFQGQVR